jgi:hypothetical protein
MESHTCDNQKNPQKDQGHSMILAAASVINTCRDAGTTGAAGASAPLAFCIFNFVGAVRVQTMGVTGAQNFYNRQN